MSARFRRPELSLAHADALESPVADGPAASVGAAEAISSAAESCFLN